MRHQTSVGEANELPLPSSSGWPSFGGHDASENDDNGIHVIIQRQHLIIKL